MQKLSNDLTKLSILGDVYNYVWLTEWNLISFNEHPGSNQNNHIMSWIVHLHHITISIFKTLLPNTMKLGLVPICRNKRDQNYKYRVPSSGWVWGIF